MDATEDGVEPSSGDILPATAGGRRYYLAMYTALAVAGLTVLVVPGGVAWSRHSEGLASAPAAPSVARPTVDPHAGATGIRPASKVTVTANLGPPAGAHRAA